MPVAPRRKSPLRQRTTPSHSAWAHLYNEGDLHSPRRDGPIRLIRIEGKNMEKVQRFPYERVS